MTSRKRRSQEFAKGGYDQPLQQHGETNKPITKAEALRRYIKTDTKNLQNIDKQLKSISKYCDKGNLVSYDEDKHERSINEANNSTEIEIGTPRKYHSWTINNSDDEFDDAGYAQTAQYRTNTNSRDSQKRNRYKQLEKMEIGKQNDALGISKYESAQQKAAVNKIENIQSQGMESHNFTLNALTRESGNEPSVNSKWKLSESGNNDKDDESLNTQRFSKSIEGMIKDLNLNRLDPKLRNLLVDYAEGNRRNTSTSASKCQNTKEEKMELPSTLVRNSVNELENWNEVVESIERQRHDMEKKLERKLSPRSKTKKKSGYATNECMDSFKNEVENANLIQSDNNKAIFASRRHANRNISSNRRSADEQTLLNLPEKNKTNHSDNPMAVSLAESGQAQQEQSTIVDLFDNNDTAIVSTPRNELDLDRIRRKRLAYLSKNAVMQDLKASRELVKIKINQKNSMAADTHKPIADAEIKQASAKLQLNTTPKPATVKDTSIGESSVISNTNRIRIEAGNTIPKLDLTQFPDVESVEGIDLSTHRSSELDYIFDDKKLRNSSLLYDLDENIDIHRRSEDLQSFQKYSWPHNDLVTQRSPRKKENRVDHLRIADIWGIYDEENVDDAKYLQTTPHYLDKQGANLDHDAKENHDRPSQPSTAMHTDNKDGGHNHLNDVVDTAKLSMTMTRVGAPNDNVDEHKGLKVKICPSCEHVCDRDRMFCEDCGTVILSVEARDKDANVTSNLENAKERIIATVKDEDAILQSLTNTKNTAIEAMDVSDAEITGIHRPKSDTELSKTFNTTMDITRKENSRPDLNRRNTNSKNVSTSLNVNFTGNANKEEDQLSPSFNTQDKPYERHWQRSSIAWSSFNPNELSNPPSNSLYHDISQELTDLDSNERIIKSKQTRDKYNMVQTSMKQDYDSGSYKHRAAYYQDNYCTAVPTSISLSLLDIPDELILMILSNISQRDLIKCCLVCRQLYRIANDTALWTEINVPKNTKLSDYTLKCIARRRPIRLTLPQILIQSYDYDMKVSATKARVTVDGLRDLFRQCSGSLQEFTMTYVQTKSTDTVGDEILLHIATRCPNVHTLNCSLCSVSDEGIISILEGCKSIMSLNVSGCLGISNRTISTAASRHGDSLYHLDIFGCSKIDSQGTKIIAYYCKNIVSLNLGQCYKLNSDDIIRLVSNLKHIEILGLRGISQVKDSCISFIARNCPKLREISLANCSKITDGAICELSFHQPSLRYLDLCGCELISDDSVNIVAQHCHSLVKIDLSSTGITRASVRALASNQCSRCLKFVKLNFCRDATQESLNFLVQHCKNLKFLHIYGCKRVRDIDALRGLNVHLNIER